MSTVLTPDVLPMVRRMADANPEWAPIGMTRNELEAEIRTAEQRPSTTVDMLTAALEYHAAGHALIPLHYPTDDGCSCSAGIDCHSIGKHPAVFNVESWLQQLSTDAIVESWTRAPQLNIGLATGERFDAFDIDGEAGENFVNSLVDGALPPSPINVTANGRHLLFAPTGHGNTVKMFDGIDWRGDGGLIVAPPSMHASGHRYRWEIHLDDIEFPAAPDWVTSRLDERSRPSVIELYDRHLADPDAPVPLPLLSALHRENLRPDRLIAGVRSAEKGKRNSQLFFAANRINEARHLAVIGDDEAEQLTGQLRSAARSAGLTDLEINRSIRSSRTIRKRKQRSS